MAKYLTREQVVLNFKNDFSKILIDSSDELIKETWEGYLEIMYDGNKISRKQKNLWVLKKDEL